MCPEQARGDAMDGRGDLYSVGVILYEMLTGRLPFADKSTMEVLLAHATEEPPAFSDVGAAGVVPPAIENVVHWCLSKDAKDRPGNARALSEAFEAALGDQPRQASQAGRIPSPDCPTPPSPPRPKLIQPIITIPPPSPPQQTIPPRPPAALPSYDPLALVNHFEAWMPEKIATYKLRGFINDVGGELLESVPGRIRVRLGGRGCVYALPPRGALSWIGLGRKNADIDMELRLHRAEQRDNQLRITVLLKPMQGDLTADVSWRGLCTQIFCDLRGYLMGSSAGMNECSV
jgi:hypothetical protein